MKTRKATTVFAIMASLLILLASLAFAGVQVVPGDIAINDIDADNNGNNVPDRYDKIFELYRRYVKFMPAEELLTAPAISAAPAIAGALEVKMMPDQERWSGEKFPVWGNVTGGTPPYTCVLDADSDGMPEYAGPVGNPKYIMVGHIFQLTPPTTRKLFTGTLTVTDSVGATASASVEVDVIELGVDPTADEPVEIRDLDVNMAIQDGLRWLYLQQQPNGSWPSWDAVGVTGEVVLAYEVQEFYPDEDSIYAPTVQAGLNFLFTNAISQPIGPQPAGNPDTDNDGIGICFGNTRQYETGIAMQAIAGALTPNAVVSAPGPVINWTYQQVVQESMDYCAWAQNENGNGRGGWCYGPNDWDSDNSVSQWPTLGLEAAEAVVGLSIPPFVKTELAIWVKYIQNANGGSGYTVPWDWVNIAKTGGLLIEQFFLGYAANTPQTLSAISYIDNDWGSDNIGNYYAMYGAMKGLRLYGVDILPSGRDWYDEYANYLLGAQKADGRWSGGPWDASWNGELNTAWAILILSPVVLPGLENTVNIDIKPTSCPNPLNIGSNGVLPVAILSTEDFDVAEVDISTILLEGVTPIRWGLEDVTTPFDGELTDEYSCTEEGPDGFVDLTLKFDKQAVVAALGEVNDSDVIILTLTANLLNGSAVSGKDVVIIRKKGKGKGKKAPGLLSFGLEQSMPNPANPESWIPYKLAQDVDVTITMYDSSGRIVRILNVGPKAAGVYFTKERAAYWDGKNEFGEKVSSGIYFYNIKAGEFSATRRMVILK